MESYEAGVIMGKILSWLILALILWGVYRIWKKIFTELFHGMWRLYAYFFPNPTKKLLQKYLFWVEFVQGISSIEAFKNKLEIISHAILYKNSYGRFYLTQEEATCESEEVEQISVHDILASQTYPFFLLNRLERITLYGKEDLHRVSKRAQMVWTRKKDILFHMILEDGHLVYPKEYPQESPFRFGYEVFSDARGFKGVYDVAQERLILGFAYKSITLYGNVARLSKDNENFFLYDIAQHAMMCETTKSAPLPLWVKEKIDLRTIELSNYVELFDVPQSRYDLESMGLWGAKVWVMEVPSGYEEILEDSNIGTIEWNHYCSADIFDMSVELPVNFKKKNGEFVSVGVAHDYLVLDKEAREKLASTPKDFTKKTEAHMPRSFEDLLVRGNLPDDPRVVPNYLKIKNAQYDDVDFSNNSVDELIKLDSEEFNELVSQTDNGLLFTWLSTLSDAELEKFYTYNEEKVKLVNDAELSSKEQFENAMASINKEEITDTQRARATLEMPLAIAYAKELYSKTIAFRMFRTYDYFKEYEEEKDARFEVTLSNIIWDEMKYIPDYFEQVLTLYRDAYDEKSVYHQKMLKHLALRFGALIATLNRVASILEIKQDSLNWFTGEMIKNDFLPPLEISVSQTKKLQSDKKLINFLTLMYAGICDENDANYLSNLIESVYTLFEWYPANSDACEYAMVEMMKSVALKEVNEENANAFMSFFEALPRFYKVLSYDKIMQLKSKINHTLATYKPLDNKIFEQKGVKNRLILLNYKIDMEDLYYEGLQTK